MRCTTFVAVAAAISAASAAPSLQARKNVDVSDPANLDHCPGRPGGEADTCTFEKQVSYILPLRPDLMLKLHS
jgi:hypothetical protein